MFREETSIRGEKLTKDSLAYVIPPPPVPALPVLGANGLFPVTRIFCLGRNYADHAREMGGNPDREPPFFFMKPANALLPEGQDFPYPSAVRKRALRIRVGRGHRRGRRRYPQGCGPKPRLWLCRRSRYDPPRSAAAGREKFASLGGRQGFRSFRSLFAGRAGKPHRPSR